ncbi:hypothetical protein [Pseudomonas sp. 58 R 12]|uniref:hypothetical protein n=1 Tax=Pseudomonas sp. 58 R 12 TaxID=1844107 RepID=UPI000811FAF1|nr:hypothetical protein [Pseudomonas sp. 58 R 12]CRM50631.1 Inner membrane protein YedI [Pseudomonas sp. 58 R 12]
MAGSSFFALFDYIATLFDDISVMRKVAAMKTASVLTDGKRMANTPSELQYLGRWSPRF